MNAQETHKYTAPLNLDNPEYKALVDYYLPQEVERDVPSGDVTLGLFKAIGEVSILAKITAKQSGILAGQEAVEAFIATLNIQQKWNFEDGENLEKGDVIVELTGSPEIVLRIERAVLNFLGRMSGIASLTKQCVDLVPRSVLICPTRKTLWSMLDKKASVIGGGGTHRIHASDAVLLKENHLMLSEEGIGALNFSEAKGRFVEIEVETEEELFQAAKKLQETDLSKVIMFDNFSVEEIKRLLPQVREQYPNILFEASGGIDLDNLSVYGNTGVDIISLGMLTHSVKIFDFSLRIQK